MFLRSTRFGLAVVCLALAAGCAQVGDFTADSQEKAAKERSDIWDGNTDPTGTRPTAPMGGRSGMDAPGGRASDAFR